MRSIPPSTNPDPPARRHRPHQLGVDAEATVAAWYTRHGFDVLDRNWRSSSGEIDVICRSGSLVVFCEVKARRSDRFGHGAEAVDAVRRGRLRRAAAEWLTEARVGWVEIRFDVVVATPGAHGMALEHFENAF